MAGAFRGLDVPAAATGTGVQALPSDALFARSAPAAAVRSGRGGTPRWTPCASGAGAQIDQSLAGLEQMYGLKLPDDLYALLGSRITLMLGGPGVRGEPEVGVRAVSDAPPADRVLTVLTDVLREQGIPATVRRTGDGWVLGTSRPLAAELTRQGDLGSRPGFGPRCPDAAQASFVALRRHRRPGRGLPGPDRPDAVSVLKALDVVGVSARTRTAGA